MVVSWWDGWFWWKGFSCRVGFGLSFCRRFLKVSVCFGSWGRNVLLVLIYLVWLMGVDVKLVVLFV